MVFDPKAYLAEDGGGEFDPADYLKDFDPAAYLDAPAGGAPAGLFNDYRPQAPALAEFSPAQMRAVREGKKDQPGLEGEDTVVNRFQQERSPVLREPGPDARPVVGLEGLPVEPQMRARTLRDDGAVIRPLESGDLSVARRVGRTVAGTSGEMVAGAGGAAQLSGRTLEKAGKGYKALAEQLGGEQGALDLLGRFYEGSGGVLTGAGQVAAGEGRALAEKMAYEDPQFLDKSVSALTSTATFIFPGLGVMKGVQALTTVPRLAAALGVASSALMESSIEAGMAREDAIQRGLTEEQADQAGYKVFAANLPITAFGNKLGVFAKAGGMVGKFARSMAAEAGQEAAQQAPQNLVAGKRLETGMGEAALYGAIAGGPFGVLETISEGRAQEIPAPQFSSRPDITPQIAQTAAQMAQVDPVAALKHVTAPADWGKVNELAGQIAADVAAVPGVSPAAQQAEVQAKLGQVLTGLMGQQAGPEMAAPAAVAAQEAPAAQGRHTGAEAFVPVEVQVIKNLIDRGSITESEISSLVNDTAKDGTLGMIVERGLAAGKTPEAMADEFAGYLEGAKKNAAAQAAPVEPGQENGPAGVLPAEQAQQMVEVPAETFVDAVTEAAPEAERPSMGEIVGAHMAMQEAAGMDAVETEATEFIEPEGEVDVSFNPAEFAAEQPAGESPAPAVAPSMRHPAAMTPEQFRERFPNAPEAAHRAIVKTAIRSGVDVPVENRKAYKDVVAEVEQEWDRQDQERGGEKNPGQQLQRLIKARGYISRKNYEEHWSGELSAENVKKYVRKDGELMMSDIAEAANEAGIIPEYDEQMVIDLLAKAEREKAFGPQVFHQAAKKAEYAGDMGSLFDAAGTVNPAAIVEETAGAIKTEPMRPENAVEQPKAASGAVQDVGDQLWYNRRNILARAMGWDDVKGLNDTLKVKEVLKSKIWPRPDYEQLVQDGMNPLTAYMVKQAYDSISTKPNVYGVPNDTQMKLFVEEVNRVREGVWNWAKDRQAQLEFGDHITKAAEKTRTDNSIMGMFGTTYTGLIDRLYPRGADGKRFNNNDAATASARILGGDIQKALQIDVADALKAAKEISEGWPAPKEMWQRRFEIHLAAKGSTVYQRGASGKTEKVTLEKDEYYITPKAKGHSYKMLVTGLESMEAAVAKAKELAEKQKAGGPRFTEAPINIHDVRREGPQRRPAGLNVSSDDLMREFGFRGVNYGNWVKQDERQMFTNYAYDGLLDLAEILNVPAKALSLNGMLGLAFGAQGTGGAAAHFMPGVNEINLTRTQGAGALAHEWFHGLDHYFAAQAGEGYAKLREPFLTEIGMTERSKSALRPEIIKAFQDIMAVVKGRPETKEEAAARAKAQAAMWVKRLDSWLTSLRKDMETNLVYYKKDTKKPLQEYDSLAARLHAGDVGEGYERISPDRYSGEVHQAVGELRRLYKDAVGRVPPIDTIRSIDNLSNYVKNDVAAEKAGKEHEPQMVPSEYRKRSRELDGMKGGEVYWSTNLEMFARAGQSYVMDKLAEQARQNDFLTRPQIDMTEMGMPFPYPKGEERTRINAAFDKLVGAVKTKETEKGVMLYQEGAGEQRLSDREAAAPSEQVEGRADGLAFVRDDLRLQLEAAGQNPETAAANAEVVAAYVQAEAKRRGVSPEQFYSEKRRIMVERGQVGAVDMKQGARASIEVLTHKVTLGQLADRSSFMHEAAHDFLQDMADYVAAGQASPEYMRFWEPVKAWLKLEDGKAINREQHEKFSRGFEAFLREGNAPSTELERAFRSFREWLLSVYRSITELDVKLNDDMRAFFGEMLTAQQAELTALTDEAKAATPAAGMTLEQGPAPERRRLQAVEAAPFSALVRRRKITPGKELTLRVTLVDTGLKAGRIARGQTVKVVDMDYQGGQFLVEKGGEYTLASPDMFRETYEKPLPEPKPLSPKAQIERSTGLKTPQQKVMLTEMDMLKEKLRNQAQGASVAARHVAREVKQKLMLDIQVRNIDIAEIRGVITEYLTTNIPQESRGKFIAMVRDAKTPLDAAKAINRIDAEAAKLYRRGLLADIRKVIDRSMDAAGVEQTYKDRIRELLAGFELQGHRESTIARLKATREWLAERRAEGKSAELPGYVMSELNILSRKPVDEIPDEALEDVLRTLRIYAELGRAKQASKENVWQIRKEEWLAKLIAGKGQGLDNLSLEALKRRGAYDFAVEAMSGVMPEDVVFDLLDGNAGYQGPHAEMKKVLDGRYGAYLAHFDEHYLPVLKLAKKNGLTEADMETIGIYAAAKQEGGAERVLEGRPDLTLEKVQALKLTPPQNEVYQAMRAAMDGTYAQVKGVNRWLYNRDIGQVEDYFSFQTDYDLLNELDLDRRMAMTPDEWAKYSKSVKKGFTKSRVKKGQGPIKINAMDIFREHMREVAYFTNMQEHIKLFFEVANTPEYRERYGAKTAKHVLNWLNLLARAGKPTSTDVMPWLDMVRVNLGRAMLGFKVTSFAIQVGSTLDAAALMGGRNVVSAMNSILSDKALRRWLLDNFPELKARVGDDIAFVELSGRSKLGKLGEAGMWPLKAIDEFSASVAVTAACFKKLGGAQLDITKPADLELVQYATLMMRRTQSSSFAKDLGIAFSVGGGRGGYLTTNASANKALLQFRSFMLNRFSMLAHDIPKMEDPGDRAWAYAYIAAAVAAETGIRWGSRALFLALFGAAGLGIGKDLEDKDAQDFAEDYFKNLFDTIPFLSDVARVLTWGNSPVPVLDAANKVFVGAHEALAAKNEYQKVKGLRDSIQGIAGLAGIAGTSQAFQLINMAVNRKTLAFPFAEEFAELDDLPIKDRTGDEKARYQVLLGAKTRWSNLNAQYRAAMERGDIEKAKAVVERASREVNAVKRSGSATEYQGKRKELGLTW